MKARLSFAFLAAFLGAATLWAAGTPSPALLVLAKQAQTIEIVDPTTLKVVATIPAGNNPHEVIASSDGRRAYMSNYGFGKYHTISVADLVNQKALPLINLGPLYGPHGLAFAGGELYFTAEIHKVIGRYNPATKKIDWILGTGQDRTHMIEVSKNSRTIFTSNVNSGTISIIQKMAKPRTSGPPRGPEGWKETVIHTGLGTEGFDVSPNGEELWAAAAQSGNISVISVAARKVVQTLHAHLTHANRLRFTPDGRYVFVSMLSAMGGDLAIFNAATRRLVKRLRLGHGAAGILMQPDGSRAYVSCSPDNYVAVIDLKTLREIGRIRTENGPDGLAWAVRK